MSNKTFTFEVAFDGHSHQLPQEGIELPTRDMELSLMGRVVRVTIKVLGTAEGWEHLDEPLTLSEEDCNRIYKKMEEVSS